MSVQLMQGDCLELMKEVPDGSVDMVLADLPYGTTACMWDSVLPLPTLWAYYKRVVKRGGVIVLFGSEPFSTMLRSSNLEWFKYDWIWVKEQSSSGLTATIAPLKKHETVSVFFQTCSDDTTNIYTELKEYMISEREKCGLSSKEMQDLLGSFMASHYFTRKTQFRIPTREAYIKLQSTGFFQIPYDDIARKFEIERNNYIVTYNPQKETGKPYKGHFAPDAEVHGSGKHFVKANSGERFPTSILQFNREKGLHPTQKPVSLLEYLIRTYTNEGETVLDNTMGSGSTGVAAVNTGRSFIGMELDPGYFETAHRRIKEAEQCLNKF